MRHLMERLLRLKQGSQGNAAVELAVLLPLLVLLAMGGIEFGRALDAYDHVVQAARQGARVAAFNAPDADVQAAATAAAAPYSPSSTPTVTRTSTQATVRVTYKFTSLVYLVSAIWGGGPLTISHSATGRLP